MRGGKKMIIRESEKYGECSTNGLEEEKRMRKVEIERKEQLGRIRLVARGKQKETVHNGRH